MSGMTEQAIVMLVIAAQVAIALTGGLFEVVTEMIQWGEFDA